MALSRRAALAALTCLLAFAAASPAHAALTGGGSIRQAYVEGARPGERLTLLSPRGRVLQRGRADRLGARIFRELRPGKGYRVTGRGDRRTQRITVLREGDDPPAAFYRGKRLREGLNYVEMRDGIELAMTVRLPPGKKLADGPFPTLIEYSGYQIAAPNDLLTSIASGKTDPLAPGSGTFVGSVMTRLLGFATVSVQMRGSGCSGGAFDLFDLPTTYDGYDAVETVAAQRWVKGGKVGMAGISFSGITQLFTAGTRPPHLAAIAPMSVTDDTYEGTGYPGGIFNEGFALSWIRDRQSDARPAPGGGQPWARALTRRGDKHCIRNQRLRLQTEDAQQIIEDNPLRTPSVFAQRAPGAWISRIDVPTFFVGQFQDEQTGGHFVSSLNRLRGNRDVWITLQNGVHVDSLAPQVLTRWVEFLKLFVADERPEIPQSVLGLGTTLYQTLADAPALPLEQSPLASLSPAEARAAFRRNPRVRLLMDNGASSAGPGAIGAAWELGFDAWPIRQVTRTPWYLGKGGALLAGPQENASGDNYVADPDARPVQTLPGNGEADAWKAAPPYRWAPVAPGKGLGWTSPPLDRDVVIAGGSSFDVWLGSSARDTDLQVTLTEVRPDGAETYVQNGWLRASHRRLDRARSTALQPVPTHRRSEPMPEAGGVEIRVPLFGVAHAFRAGSRIRVTLTAPGGDRPRWRFRTVDAGKTTNTVSQGGITPSKLVLPVVAGVTANGTPLPAPAALRGQPSRPYVPASNGG